VELPSISVQIDANSKKPINFFQIKVKRETVAGSEYNHRDKSSDYFYTPLIIIACAGVCIPLNWEPLIEVI